MMHICQLAVEWDWVEGLLAFIVILASEGAEERVRCNWEWQGEHITVSYLGRQQLSLEFHANHVSLIILHIYSILFPRKV